MRGRALSVRTAGTTIALFVGVPVGTVVGGYFGWRTSFVLVSALAAVAAMGVGSLLPPTRTPARRGSLRHLGVARSGAVLGVLGITVLVLMATFVVYTYMRPLIEALTSFGVGNVGLMLGLFGLASIPGTFLGGYAADRWGYGRSMAVILAVASVSLLLFSAVFVSEAGSVVAIVSTGVLLVLWSIATFMHFPLQQYRLIEVAPQEDQGTALSLNASAIWGGQGLGAGLGALILHYGSLVGLGLGGASCALVALAVLARQSGARRSSRTLRKTS
jgi:predicted MFS family arabinose efflux permease